MSFEDILHSGCCVAFLVVAWFRSVPHKGIPLALFFADVALVCKCFTFSIFYAESIRIQL